MRVNYPLKKLPGSRTALTCAMSGVFYWWPQPQFLDALLGRELSPTNLVMVYLLMVVISAVYLGRGPAILASILGVLAFDFFFVPSLFYFFSF